MTSVCSPACGSSEVRRDTSPRAEWLYVVEGKAPTVSTRQDSIGMRLGWTLADYAAQAPIKAAGLLLAEVAGIRLYTGPMYREYNATLRNRTKGAYVTTLHAVNSGIVKLSRTTPAAAMRRAVCMVRITRDQDGDWWV